MGLELYPSCKECRSKVIQIVYVVNVLIVKLSKCPSSMLAKVNIEDDNGHSHHATMFTKVIEAIVGDGACTKCGKNTAISAQLLQRASYKTRNGKQERNETKRVRGRHTPTA